MATCELQSGEFRYGEILGCISLNSTITTRASQFAADYYSSADAADFSGDPVGNFAVPDWFPPVDSVLPFGDLERLHLCCAGLVNELIATVGVDQHVDNLYGTVLCLVLHNDGLNFRQGGVTHKPSAGDWFIFNDRIKHGVKEAKGASVFLALVVPLVSLES